MRVHKDCGGDIIKGTCQKCQKKFGRLDNLLWKGQDEKKVNTGFDPKAYRKRIRNGDDLK